MIGFKQNFIIILPLQFHVCLMYVMDLDSVRALMGDGEYSGEGSRDSALGVFRRDVIGCFLWHLGQASLVPVASSAMDKLLLSECTSGVSFGNLRNGVMFTVWDFPEENPCHPTGFLLFLSQSFNINTDISDSILQLANVI